MIHIYKYKLATKAQRNAIDLRDYESELKNVLMWAFRESFVNLVITQDTYTLEVTNNLTTAEKRQLGRLLATSTSLGQYVEHKVYPNSRSSKLFTSIS